MNKMINNILDNISEGIVIINKQFEIVFWNEYMEQMTGMNAQNVLHQNVLYVLPFLDTNYFSKLIHCVIRNGCKMFFSAALHKDIIINKKVNLKISKIKKDQLEFVMFEFIDVTNQFARITQLKEYVEQLYTSNEKLKEKEKIIKKLAYYDGLTGVANRILFYKVAQKMLNTARKHNSLLGLMFIDVDKFKNINDTYGHKLGDNVLVKVAKILKQSIKDSDIVARFGGDEFLILLPMKRHDDYKTVISRINRAKNRRLHYEGREIEISLSIGVSFYPHDGRSIDELILKADQAMYNRKNECASNSGEER